MNIFQMFRRLFIFKLYTQEYEGWIGQSTGNWIGQSTGNMIKIISLKIEGGV